MGRDGAVFYLCIEKVSCLSLYKVLIELKHKSCYFVRLNLKLTRVRPTTDASNCLQGLCQIRNSVNEEGC
jgi:hypothetical protein